jgi:4-diphosphocytidyl-2-C-methyl-D-erythritol kinase
VTQSSSIRRVGADAPAKINLFLHVTGRREDGYHLLESLVVFTETGDRLTVETADALTLEIEGPFAAALPAAGADNLVLRAASMLREAGSVDVGARIVLEKNLPVSSGIGGGSADAAAALRALCALWELSLAEAILAGLGLSLGADVPVCLYARPAMMSGVGERVDNVDPPPGCGVVLVNAREAVSTPDVFNARTAEFSAPSGWNCPTDFESLIRALMDRRNDLLAPALLVSPVIGDVLGALEADPACALARLSGSGGTCFGLYPSIAQANTARERISSDHPDWWCVATTFRDQAPSVSSG